MRCISRHYVAPPTFRYSPGKSRYPDLRTRGFHLSLRRGPKSAVKKELRARAMFHVRTIWYVVCTCIFFKGIFFCSPGLYFQKKCR